MNAPNSHDHKKFDYALVTRDIRRLTALIHRADIDSGTRAMIDAALEQLEARVWVTLLHDPVTNTLINNQDEVLGRSASHHDYRLGRRFRHAGPLCRSGGRDQRQ